MTITESPRPTRNGPVALVRGLLAGAVTGTSLTALVVGTILEDPPLLVGGMALPVCYGLLLLLAGAPRRRREAAVVPRTALAMVEDMRAMSSESGDIPVDFTLTVAPDDGPAFRVETLHQVNLVDLPSYRRGDVLVVRYPPDRPWKAKIAKPTPSTWADRAAGARIDSAPEHTLAQPPPEGRVFGVTLLVGLLIGVAAVLHPMRADLFGSDSVDGPSPQARPSVSVTESSSTVTSTAGTGVVTVSGGSLLDDGELRRAVDSLLRGRSRSQVITAVVQERMLTVVYAPDDAPVPQFGLRTLPFGRIPALVKEAVTSVHVGSPASWQLTVDHLTGTTALRISVTGPRGTGYLQADAKGNVVRRVPATP